MNKRQMMPCYVNMRGPDWTGTKCVGQAPTFREAQRLAMDLQLQRGGVCNVYRRPADRWVEDPVVLQGPPEWRVLRRRTYRRVMEVVAA